MKKQKMVEQAYKLAVEAYAGLGVNVKKALDRLESVKISLHCWQGDDVSGFESSGNISDGGIMATGNYPGRRVMLMNYGRI